MAHHAEAHDEDEQQPLVLSVSKKNPGVRVIQVKRPAPEETSFISATVKGLGITLRHFFTNVITKSGVETIQYPDHPEGSLKYPARSRGLHRLMLRDDDSVRCVACMCCPTVCPAKCITIVPAQSDDNGVEKFPATFEIDELRCVVCGLCVESCPCDAIRMDTGEHAPPVENRAESIMNKEALSSRGDQSIAIQGGSGPDWRKGL